MSVESDTDVERIEPAETPALELALHVSRYRFVSTLVAGRTVLDAGCGVGYGSDEFTTGLPAYYVGVDRFVDAIRLAQRRYAVPGRLFLAADVMALPCASQRFDIVLSFEVLEHVHEVDRYLVELRRVLRPGGTCVVSTPNKRWFSDNRTTLHNPYHVREYYAAELAALLGEYFPAVTLLGQHDGARAQVVRRAQTAYGRLLDRSGLRRLRRVVPRRLRTWAHQLFVDLASRARGVRPAAIDAGDYTFSSDRVDEAQILVGVCRMS
jgi:2-polyprenyl-3-methyl-5-hydroxy-6-metoxy-1,4-benzoquinol methylase